MQVLVAAAGSGVAIEVASHLPASLPHRHGVHHAVRYRLVSAPATSREQNRAVSPPAIVPDRLANAVPARVASYLAGRFCARHALRRLGSDEPNPTIGFGVDGSPRWPTGTVGSITHTADRAIALVASTRNLRGVGIDCERLLSDEEGAELAERVAPELPALLRGRRGSRRLRAGEALSVVFSAKESLYKCLYPIAGEFFDFDDVRAESLDLDGASGELTLVLGRSLGGCFRRGEKFRAALVLEAAHVVTTVELPAGAGAAGELLSTLRTHTTVGEEGA